MVKLSLPILPNCNITFSTSAAGMPGEALASAPSWKFFTEATVTRPLKLRHQHCSCSCHLGPLFLSTSGSLRFCIASGVLDWSKQPESDIASFLSSTGAEERFSNAGARNDNGVGALPPSRIEETGTECMTHCILLGPLVRRTFNW